MSMTKYMPTYGPLFGDDLAQLLQPWLEYVRLQFRTGRWLEMFMDIWCWPPHLYFPKCRTSSASDYALLQIQQGLLHKALAQLPNLTEHQEFSGQTMETMAKQWPNKRWLFCGCLFLSSSWLYSTTVSITSCRWWWWWRRRRLLHIDDC